MSGWTARCARCGNEVVVRRWRVRFGVTCPRCRTAVEVPEHFDFRRLDRATDVDVVAAETMTGVLALSVLLACCVPMAAWTWWWSEGAVARARAEQRPVPQGVRRLRTASIVATFLYLALWFLFLVSR